MGFYLLLPDYGNIRPAKVVEGLELSYLAYQVQAFLCIISSVQLLSRVRLFPGQEYRRRCREWICGHRVGEDGGKNWEIRIQSVQFSCSVVFDPATL